MISTREQLRPALAARRLSAEEFCALARQCGGGFYRPRCEVLRLLAVGQAWGAAAPGMPTGAALVLLGLDADVPLAASLRQARGVLPGRGYLLTPPLGAAAQLPAVLSAAAHMARRLVPRAPLAAVTETGEGQEAVLEAYFAAGFAMRALRPFSGLVPEYLLDTAPLPQSGTELWIPLADATHLALLLARGWAAAGCRAEGGGWLLRMVPAR